MWRLDAPRWGPGRDRAGYQWLAAKLQAVAFSNTEGSVNDVALNSSSVASEAVAGWWSGAGPADSGGGDEEGGAEVVDGADSEGVGEEAAEQQRQQPASLPE